MNPVYATAQGVRLAAQIDNADHPEPMVAVWHPGGPALGLYRLARFEGGKLTPATLKKLFTP